MIALYVYLKNSISHNGSWSQYIRPGKQVRPNFLRSTSLLYKILPTSLGTCKPIFYTFYASHLRWNSTMRRCFYHTDLGQNAVFHKFAIQIALIQYSGRSKKFSKSPIRRAGSHFWQAQVIRFNIICIIFKSVRFARHFDYSCKRCSWATENKRHSD